MAFDPDMDEVVKEFLVESQENLDLLDQGFLQLEKNPGDRAIVASIFRTIHTIKGTAGFLGFSKLETLTHAAESLLSLMRDGVLVLDTERANALLLTVDAVRRMLAQIEAERSDGSDDHATLIGALNALQSKEPALSAPAVVPPPNSPAPEHHDVAKEHLTVVPPVAPPAPPLVAAAPAPPAVIALGDARDDVTVASSVSESSIRVDVGLLDKLMNLVGELVLARNQVLQFTAKSEGTSLMATSQRLNLITTELQEGVMKTRMQPIGNVWSKFPRVVRDLSAACHKQVEIEMEGRETELDKTIIEAIKDPLTHVVRNAIDHGMELPDVRVKAGKAATGRLALRAFHEGGQVNIEISDDGRGIDVEKVRSKALQRGLITRENAERMGEREIVNLIFLPGFSTAEALSNISGRGVGMDVVRTNIEKIGGTVEVESVFGKGTTIRIKIPLTLAIIPALIVMSGGDRFAIPQVSLLELVRLEEEQAHTAIEFVHNAPVYRLRGNLLPLVHLETLFHQSHRMAARGAVNIVVLQAGERQFGLVVAGINDTEEIVVKPLAKQLKGIPTFAGATIMGDGKVALILDVLGIAQHAGVVSHARDRGMGNAGSAGKEEAEAKQSYLLCGVGQHGRVAIPLAAVDRLEEFRTANTERAGHHRVIQYRGRVLPLLWLDQLLPEGQRVHTADREPESYPVVVFQDGDRCLGLVVDRILDIIEENLVLEHPSTRPGIVGCAVMQGRVTEVLDIPGAIAALGGPTTAARRQTLNEVAA